MDEITIVIPDSSAKNAESYLAKLERISDERNDGGMIHGGHIHYIQQKMGEDGFTLKAAIVGVLENVPQVFPLNFGELLSRDNFEPTDEQNRVFMELNQGLLIPISGMDIVDIIEKAKEYEALSN